MYEGLVQSSTNVLNRQRKLEAITKYGQSRQHRAQRLNN